ncbi:MAG: TolC family protein, partial [Planctomycetales bacterium]|nr:TolC family protein [Planctomycetales bacterium]
EYWDISLQEAIQIGLQNGKILRSLGGQVIRSPQNAPTILDAAIAATDPRVGVEASLAPFDTLFFTNTNVENNDRAYNSQIISGSRSLRQDLIDWQMGLTKKSAAGTEFTFRQNITYDSSNVVGNEYYSVYDISTEFEFRQPLLRGRGTLFNRTAGPNASPGLYHGVLIAQTNADISLSELEIGLRDFVSDIENAYWELYFAYRQLDARRLARDASYQTWQRVLAFRDAGRRGGEAAREAQARSQYYVFERQLKAALGGPAADGTRTTSGVDAGDFRGVGSVYANERQLRRILGLDSTDGRLIRPQDDPVPARLVFDWDELRREALHRRAELRRQRSVVRKQEMELWASRQLLLPKLDALGLYRVPGIGDDLTSGGSGDTNAFDAQRSGDFQEWQLGLRMEIPMGFRAEHSAVQNAHLRLTRAQFQLDEQQQQITNRLSDAVARVDGTYELAESSKAVYDASWDELQAVQAAYDAGESTLDQVLDAQRRYADSQSTYFRSLVSYVVAIKNLHYQKGSILEYNHVFFSNPADTVVASTTSQLRGLKSSKFMDYVIRAPRGKQKRVPPGATLASDSSASPGTSVPTDSSQPKDGINGPAARVARALPETSTMPLQEGSRYDDGTGGSPVTADIMTGDTKAPATASPPLEVPIIEPKPQDSGATDSIDGARPLFSLYQAPPEQRNETTAAGDEVSLASFEVPGPYTPVER